MCCRRPVIVSRSPGLSDYLDPSDGISVVEPFDSNGWRQAIVQLLEHPEKSGDQADRGFRLGSERYDFDQAVNRFEKLLQSP
jgi:glycosyltransferase involved in cell wall biosynthesis